MTAQVVTGIFGKLPAHGDFIHRNLATRAINSWDTWLQTFIGSTQERLGESWLDVYLTSPIWRFCLSQGVVDDQPWAGVMLPSVDRVGRYFPIVLMRPIPNTIAPTEFVTKEGAWFEAIEAGALQALEGHIQVDQLLELANGHSPVCDGAYQKRRALPVTAGVVVDQPMADEAVAHSHAFDTMPHLLDAFVSTTFSSYSVWSTNGSECVAPCTFICSGLPPIAGGAAMLDGLWGHWEWSVPVRFDQALYQPLNLAVQSSTRASDLIAPSPIAADAEPANAKPAFDAGSALIGDDFLDEPLLEPSAVSASGGDLTARCKFADAEAGSLTDDLQIQDASPALDDDLSLGFTPRPQQDDE